MICDKFDVNAQEVIKLANKHPRVNILNPGCGVGGHCIAVDPWFIAHAVPDLSPLIQTARKVNIAKQTWVENKILSEARSFEERLKVKATIGIFGVTFKPDIDDTRESPALKIVNNIIRNMGEKHFVNQIFQALMELTYPIYMYLKIDIIVLLVSHSLFKGLNFTGKQVLDYCNMIVMHNKTYSL